MTTIIATRQGLFCDTKCSYTVPFRVKKHTKIGGSLFAGAGDVDDIKRFFDWRQGDAEQPSFEDGIDILEVCGEGIFLWGKKLVRLRVLNDVYAIGSGCQYAMGALAFGATPKEALAIAAKFDDQTAAPFEFVKLAR